MSVQELMALTKTLAQAEYERHRLAEQLQTKLFYQEHIKGEIDAMRVAIAMADQEINELTRRRDALLANMENDADEQ